MGSKNLGALHLATQTSIIKTRNSTTTTTNDNDDNINTQVGISLKQSP